MLRKGNKYCFETFQLFSIFVCYVLVTHSSFRLVARSASKTRSFAFSSLCSLNVPLFTAGKNMLFLLDYFTCVFTSFVARALLNCSFSFAFLQCYHKQYSWNDRVVEEIKFTSFSVVIVVRSRALWLVASWCCRITLAMTIMTAMVAYCQLLLLRTIHDSDGWQAINERSN